MSEAADGRTVDNGSRGSINLAGITKRYGDFTAIHELDLEIHPGEFFAFLGPSGSGKTTSLRIVAGLEAPDEGRVLLDGADVTGRQPGDRDIAMVFQNYALYPHMTVAQNIGFPLKMVGTPGAEISARVTEAADRVQMGHLLQRKPGQLSGGQQQRVALARAIVRHPNVFLLDEPLSNLDAQLRMDTRVTLKRLQLELGVTALYVTHDQEEAVTLADRMAVFMDGRVVQVGPPRELFDRPGTTDVAAFLGRPPMNLLPGTVSSKGLTVEGIDTTYPDVRADEEQAVTVGFRPREIDLAGKDNQAEVFLAESTGEQTIVNLSCGPHLVKAQVDGMVEYEVGRQQSFSLPAEALHLFDAESGVRLSDSPTG
ncbi:MAG: ATP-binding cassette domain-containing protein [Streptosporangiales bacterium]|nr:ATP-binding cassette domain-containing protein [Streptosporangiales bacterium]